MQYLGIDQHKRHLTICLRNEQGDIELRRQVGTSWYDMDQFLQNLQDRTAVDGGYVAILEVCGFNEWLIERLNGAGCRCVYLIQPPERIRHKTDRRDAGRLSELLWLNRDRIASGQRLIHVREVYQPSADEQYDRTLTHMRHRLGRTLTRTKNGIKKVLRRRNLEQGCPTKGLFTQAGVKWLRSLALPEMDRCELDQRLEEYDLYTRQIKEVECKINQRADLNPRVQLVRTMPKVGRYTALALLAHIGPIKRFPSARALANFFGLTPGCRNSGEAVRPGSITKAGHPLVRFLLGQMVLHALRGDGHLREWYRQIKRRRGSKIARVAVMRRLCTSLWHMLYHQQPYQNGAALEEARKRKASGVV
jgi:transposase